MSGFKDVFMIEDIMYGKMCVKNKDEPMHKAVKLETVNQLDVKMVQYWSQTIK